MNFEHQENEFLKKTMKSFICVCSPVLTFDMVAENKLIRDKWSSYVGENSKIQVVFQEI